MRLDLSFQDDAAEAEYRRTRLKKHAEAVEWMRVVAAACAVARLALLHASPGTIAAALLACLSKGAQLLLCGKGNLRCGVLGCWGAGARGGSASQHMGRTGGTALLEPLPPASPPCHAGCATRRQCGVRCSSLQPAASSCRTWGWAAARELLPGP